jgi:hypothetical protein
VACPRGDAEVASTTSALRVMRMNRALPVTPFSISLCEAPGYISTYRDTTSIRRVRRRPSADFGIEVGSSSQAAIESPRESMTRWATALPSAISRTAPGRSLWTAMAARPILLRPK